MTTRIGVREFRDRATRLIASGEVLAIERHGSLVGYFVPVAQHRDTDHIEDAIGRLRNEAGAETLETLRARREEVAAISAGHGASNVRVFGSVARGEATTRGDIDLLVDFGSDRTLLDQAGLAQDLAALFGRAVDVVTEHGLKPAIRASVIAEAQPL
jgi:predicted nucleotidyltransferase